MMMMMMMMMGLIHAELSTTKIGELFFHILAVTRCISRILLQKQNSTYYYTSPASDRAKRGYLLPRPGPC
jgi:hypothetical protein